MKKLILAGLALIILVLSSGPGATAEEQRDKSGQWLEEIRREQLGGSPQAVSMEGSLADRNERQLRALIQAGAVHRPEGFKAFSNRKVPFKRHQRIKSNRLDGPAVYATLDGCRIFKYLFCDGFATVWVELSIMDKAGHQVAFAWQDCGLDCAEGGACNSSNPLYLDLNGDSNPELRFESLESITRMERINVNYWEVPLYTFQVDIVPGWVWEKMGPDRREECGIKPRDEVELWIDHPLNVVGSLKSFGERVKRKP